jgi:predicted SprT family Zn-dependent metalloprotease
LGIPLIWGSKNNYDLIRFIRNIVLYLYCNQNKHIMNLEVDVLVSVKRVRDMGQDYIKRDWNYRGRNFNLNALGWSFGLNDRKGANGVCSPNRKRISLSEYVIDNATREMSGWVNTMVHEIAHAINHELGGRGHDRQWKAIFLSLGGNGERCSRDTKFENLVEKPISKYTNVCPNGHASPSHKISRVVRSCGKCCPTFNKDYIIKQIKNY